MYVYICTNVVHVHIHSRRGGIQVCMSQEWMFHIRPLLQNGYTALHLAVLHCKPQAVQTLLGYGASVELKGGLVMSGSPHHTHTRTHTCTTHQTDRLTEREVTDQEEI